MKKIAIAVFIIVSLLFALKYQTTNRQIEAITFVVQPCQFTDKINNAYLWDEIEEGLIDIKSGTGSRFEINKDTAHITYSADEETIEKVLKYLQSFNKQQCNDALNN